MRTDEPRVFNTPKETAEAFGDYLIQRILESEVFHCALSGGSTPKLLFQYLAENYADSPAWQQVHLYWGDERCVPPEDKESNFKMTNDLLLSKVPIPEGNVHRVRGEEDPEQEAKRYADELIQWIGGKPSFDLIILGMGDDGHTASIFPHQMELLEQDGLCAVATHPTSGQQRVSLTGPVINGAKEVVFLVTGAGKKERIREIFKQEGNWEKYPASHVKPENGALKWYLDEGAASGLQ